MENKNKSNNSISTSKYDQFDPLLQPKNFNQLTSSNRSYSVLSISNSTTPTDIEHGFTTEEDFNSNPHLSNRTLISLAAAPMPTVIDFLNPQSSSPQQTSNHSSPNLDLAIQHQDLNSSSSQLSRPSRLSDENLKRQSSGIKERVKRSTKMRQTERWARETSSNSELNSNSQQINSSTSIQPSNQSQAECNPSNSFSILLPLSPNQIINYTHASPSPDTLPPPRLSLRPVPSFRAIPNPEDNAVVPSEHATVNDWQSENTNVTPFINPSQSSGRQFLPISPMDVQFIGQTPTSAEFHSFSHLISPPIQPGTVIASRDDSRLLLNSHNIPISSSSLIHSTPHQSDRSPLPVEDISTDLSNKLSLERSDPLLLARMNLQQALAATPLARSSSKSSPITQHLPQPHFGGEKDKQYVQDENDDDEEEEEEEEEEFDQDNESGLSPIKEDRTAELAAEHSWKIKQMLPSTQVNSQSLNQLSHQLKSSTSTQLIDHTQIHLNQSSNLSHPQRSKSDGEINSNDFNNNTQVSLNDKSTPSDTLISLEADDNANNPTQNISSNSPSVDLHDVISAPMSDLTRFDSKKDLLTGPNSTNEERPHMLSCDQVMSQKSSSPKETHPDSIPGPSSHQSTSIPPQTEQIISPSNLESSSTKSRAPPSRVRTVSQRPSPPLSVPASARRPPPEDSLCRLEMEEWRNQTGVDDRYSLSLRTASCSSSISPAAGSLPMSNAFDFDRVGLVGLGGEERRGIKDRWGNSWGLESHILSPLTEHTELTTVGSILSLSTRKSNHSLGSLDSTNNSIAQRLDQADSNPMRMIKLGATLIPSGVIRGTQTNTSHRPVSCPINRIDSPTKLTALNKIDSHKESSSSSNPLLLEEKLKRREERRLRREKREQRRAREIKSSENLAQKQERRRQEKKKKEEFLEKKHQILQRLQETGEDAKLIRDLGILYMTSNVGVVGLKLAIRHLETSLQMDDSDPLAWSCLGKTWTYLHGIPDTETPKMNHFQEANKVQQAHNATIGLRKAIINSRTYHEVIKYKIEWARFLEKIGRWRDSLGLISELLKNLGKSEFKCWANLGFTAMRIIFNWPPLSNLEADDLEQGFQKEEDDDETLASFFHTKVGTENLNDSDRLKLLIQVHNAFDRALTLLDERIVSSHLTNVNEANRVQPVLTHDHHNNNQASEIESVDQLKIYKDHYRLQLNKVQRVEKKLQQDKRQSPVSSRLTRDYPPHISLSSSRESDLAIQTSNVQSDGGNTTQPVISKDLGEVTEEILECNSISLHSQNNSPPRPAIPVFRDQQEEALHEVTSMPHHTPELNTPNCLGITTSNSKVDQSRILPEDNRGSLESMIQNVNESDIKLGRLNTPVISTSDPSQEQPDKLINLHTARQFASSDGDVSFSDGPEVIVQYDDVDTTNDYSEKSRNSDDPFRPSSHLGHHHHFINPSFSNTHPFNHTMHDRSDSGQALSVSDSKIPTNNSQSFHAEEKLDHSDDNSHCNCSQSANLPHLSLSKDTNHGTENKSGLLRESSSTIQDVPLTPSRPFVSAPDPIHVDSLPISTIEGSVGLANGLEPSTSRHVLRDIEYEYDNLKNKNYSLNQVDEEESYKRNNKTPDQLRASFPVLPNSEISLNHKMSNLGLGSPVQRKLRGLDKEKLIAFLELDSHYHSQVSKLRKKLIKIEEEREAMRKETFQKLGIKEFYDDQRDHEDDLTDREEVADEASVRGSGLGVSEQSNRISKATGNEREEGIGENDSQLLKSERKKDRYERLESSFSSIRSTSSAPTRPKLSQHHQLSTQRNKYFIPTASRSVCSPIQRNDRNRGCLRARALSFNGLGAETASPLGHNRGISGVDNSCNSTAVNDTSIPQSTGHHSPIPPPPGSSDSNQANIALQGIAAILKLATSTQSN